MSSEMNWNNQTNFIEYAKKFANDNKIHILLGGSFSKGTETPFSDIDLYLFTDNKITLHDFIYNYGRPVYISQTINPKGIIIVIYENGVALDLEIVKGTVKSHNYFSLKTEVKCCIEINSDIADNFVLCSDKLYSVARLFHRSAIKYLSGKHEFGISVLSEIADELKTAYDKGKTFKQNFSEIISLFEKTYPLTNDYKNILNHLIDYI